MTPSAIHHFHVRSMPMETAINRRTALFIPVARPIGTIAMCIVGDQIILGASWATADRFCRRAGTAIAVSRVKSRLDGKEHAYAMTTPIDTIMDPERNTLFGVLKNLEWLSIPPRFYAATLKSLNGLPSKPDMTIDLNYLIRNTGAMRADILKTIPTQTA